MAGGILGVRRAIQGVERGWAQAVAVRGECVASKGEAREGKFGRVVALTGHGESMAKNTYFSTNRGTAAKANADARLKRRLSVFGRNSSPRSRNWGLMVQIRASFFSRRQD
jgi:hypothetical protein